MCQNQLTTLNHTHSTATTTFVLFPIISTVAHPKDHVTRTKQYCIVSIVGDGWLNGGDCVNCLRPSHSDSVLRSQDSPTPTGCVVNHFPLYFIYSFPRLIPSTRTSTRTTTTTNHTLSDPFIILRVVIIKSFPTIYHLPPILPFIVSILFSSIPFSLLYFRSHFISLVWEFLSKARDIII